MNDEFKVKYLEDMYNLNLFVLDSIDTFPEQATGYDFNDHGKIAPTQKLQVGNRIKEI